VARAGTRRRTRRGSSRSTRSWQGRAVAPRGPVPGGATAGGTAATVPLVARNPRRLSFESASDMARHLNGWSALSLTGPEQWTDALVASRQWLDYSARNQMLLASYGVDGPVAGRETWRLVPSTSDERPCAVRAGKHGWPVRVPITTGGSEPDPLPVRHPPVAVADRAVRVAARVRGRPARPPTHTRRPRPSGSTRPAPRPDRRRHVPRRHPQGGPHHRAGPAPRLGATPTRS
jgi:hypothetical protein